MAEGAQHPEGGDGELELVQRVLAGTHLVEKLLVRRGATPIYLATELKRQRHVALRIFPPELGLGPVGPRFEEASRLALTLKHPHILRSYAVGLNEGVPFYVAMKLVDGKTLHEIIQTQGALSVPAILGVLRAAAAALANAHQHGTVHGALTPGSILIDRSGHVVVSDFAIVRAIAEATAERVGKLRALAPEEQDGRAAGEPGDQYALGLAALAMLTGDLPVGEASADPLTSLRDVRAARVALPDILVRAVQTMLARDPAQRFTSAKIMLAGIKAIPFSDADAREATVTLGRLARGEPVAKIRALTPPKNVAAPPTEVAPPAEPAVPAEVAPPAEPAVPKAEEPPEPTPPAEPAPPVEAAQPAEPASPVTLTAPEVPAPTELPASASEHLAATFAEAFRSAEPAAPPAPTTAPPAPPPAPVREEAPEPEALPEPPPVAALEEPPTETAETVDFATPPPPVWSPPAAAPPPVPAPVSEAPAPPAPPAPPTSPPAPAPIWQEPPERFAPQPPMPVFEAPPPPPPPLPPAPVVEAPAPEPAVVPAPRVEEPKPRERRRRLPVRPIAATLAVAFLVVAAYLLVGRRPAANRPAGTPETRAPETPRRPEARRPVAPPAPRPESARAATPARPVPANAGQLVLNVDPTTASIYLNGIACGFRGALDTMLTPGQRRVSIVADGFLGFDTLVTTRAGEPVDLGEIVLRTSAEEFIRASGTTGLLRLTTIPRTAQIFVAGRLVGTGSLVDYQLAAGSWQVRVTAPGWVPYDRYITVNAGETVRLGEISLEHGPGR